MGLSGLVDNVLQRMRPYLLNDESPIFVYQVPFITISVLNHGCVLFILRPSRPLRYL